MANPNGEIFEIFSWLPAKSLFKLAAVAQSCNEFSSSEDFFAKKQSQNMVHKNDSTFFMQPKSYCKQGEPEFQVLPDEKSSSGVPNKSLNFLKKFGHLLGSSNGLVCCKNTSSEKKPKDGQLFICNPTTQRWLSIPDIPDPWRFEKDFNIMFQCNMGQSDEFLNDYFLMALQGTEDWTSDLVCKVYSPAEGIWQEKGLLNFGPRRILFESVMYQKGVFYMLSDWSPYLTKESRFYWPYIVEFDPKKGTSAFLQIPEQAKKHFFRHTDLDMGIFNFGRGNQKSICLVMVSKGVFIVWGQNKSGSWREILKVRARAMRMVEPDPQIAGFTVINGDSLLVATKKRVYRYSLTSHWRWKRAEKVCSNKCGGSVSFYPYSNTLRPCGDGTTPVPT